MSTEETKTDNTIYATLVRGRVYFLRDREFLAGVPTPVTQDERDWLEVHAVDQVSVEDENEFQSKAKFKFSVGKAAAAETAPRARQRR